MCWKVGSIDCPEERRFDRRGHGGAGHPIEQRHLAEEISRLDKPECLLLTAPAGLRDLYGPFADEIQEIARIALTKNDLACVQLNDMNVGRNLLEQIGFDALEEPILG